MREASWRLDQPRLHWLAAEADAAPYRREFTEDGREDAEGADGSYPFKANDAATLPFGLLSDRAAF